MFEVDEDKKTIDEVDDDPDTGDDQEQTTTDQENGQSDTDDNEQDENTDGEQESESTEEEEETVITLDGEEVKPQQQDNSVIRKLRQANKELKKQLRQYNQQQEQINTAQEIQLPPKPTLDKFEYDTEQYEKALDSWYNKSIELNQIKKQKESEAKKARELFEKKTQKYTSGKTELNIDDFDDVEDTVGKVLSREQQFYLLRAADNPAALVYAIGKSKNHLEQLKQINDPIEFAAQIARLETKIDVKRGKKPKANPEKIPSGSSASPGSKEKQLEKLREKAAKTGDNSEVIRFRRLNNL